ncbi:hypothetical protein HanRHA438_Chr08g0337681 [Helianthus annuus]|nr:hypothetical protein HanXRQr2_Chr08g0326521 [Helianthus annuus]KAJ0537991.1 hypothetical protein HanHA300_Chr08g0269941 [Helianthus annuus]KAJ0545709.1 hypothetical protein HanIR_Chr08g0352781 [Helianthus annuus]KAJ0552579.1 hypothetical protein HanHA89_Chr08g0286791 [Helianthus annuus]KAJ0718274.1 hypothetical protein HanLR1_Chr08g0268811 [Helianthus annuus]
MHKLGVEAMGVGALKFTRHHRMQQRNLHFDSLFTVRQGVYES